MFPLLLKAGLPLDAVSGCSPNSSPMVSLLFFEILWWHLLQFHWCPSTHFFAFNIRITITIEKRLKIKWVYKVRKLHKGFQNKQRPFIAVIKPGNHFFYFLYLWLFKSKCIKKVLKKRKKKIQTWWIFFPAFTSLCFYVNWHGWGSWMEAGLILTDTKDSN